MDIAFTSETRNVVDLIPAEYNPRSLSKKQHDEIKKSIKRFNFVDPIIINLNNRIIGGHQRLKVLKDIGVDVVDVRVSNRELSCEEEKELNLRLNKNTGDWDFDLLKDFGRDMLVDVGFDSDELDKIFQLEPEPKDDEVPELPEEPKTKLGDLYQLGNHRLLCGDSTNVDDVEKLMDGKKADMVFTDPPYGMNLDTDYSKLTSSNSFASGKKHSKVIGDDKEYNPDHIFNQFGYCLEILLWGADYYRKYLPIGGSWFCWDKREDESADKGFGSNFELLWSRAKHKRSMLRYKWFGFFTAGEKREYLHPTQKPVEMLIQVLNPYCIEKGLVVDLFLGSGSTLIACEKTNRICYGMELDPKYCDVIVQRWEEYTGNKAELERS